jgi:hypothetical protein
MALEKFIVGKHDDGKHEGKASELRRIASAEEELRDFLEGVEPVEDEQVIKPLDKLIVSCYKLEWRR